MKFIKKLFIKNYRNTDDPSVRHRYGVVGGVIGIILNILIFILGIVVGLISGSITIVVQSVGMLTDAFSSILTLIGFKLASKPADKEHPYGHARMEHIIGLIISLTIFTVGIIFTKSCIEAIFEPEDLLINIYSYIVLSITILVKLFLFLMYLNLGKSIKSDTLIASGIDSRNDMITTVAIIISLVIMQIFNINIDAYLGLAISIFIIISACKLIGHTIDPLISVKPEKKLVNKIKKELLSFDGVEGFHDLLVHSYGVGSNFATVHLEVSEKTSLSKCHEMVDMIERHFEEKLDINLTIQVDPVDKENPITKKIHDKVLKTIQELNKDLTIHGLRVIYGNNTTKVLFDITEDFNSHLSKAEIYKKLDSAFSKEKTKFIFYFTIDKPFI